MSNSLVYNDNGRGAHVDGTSSAMTTPRWLRWTFVVTVALLAITGFGQMPIYSRYYISSLPGLQWTANFYFTHTLHYLGASVFLALLTYQATRHLAHRAGRKITLSGKLRIILYMGVAITGVFRVLKNLPSLFFDPVTIMVIDWTHLAFVMLLGVVALVAWISGRGRYFLKD